MKAGLKASSPGSGAKHLISFVHDWGHPEWIIIAVKSPIGDVTDAYAKLRGATEMFRSVPVKPARKKDAEIAPLVAIAKPKRSSWSVIFRSLCLPLEERDFNEAAKNALALSAKLKTRVATFCGTDTSYSMSLSLFAGGKLIEQKEWDQNSSPEKAFHAAGLYLPTCFPCRADGVPWLAVPASSHETIEEGSILNLEPLAAKSRTNARVSPAEAKKLAVKLHRAALAGNLAQIKQVIAAGADVNRGEDLKSWDGFSPLIAAASKGRLAAVKLLLAEGAEVDLSVLSEGSDWTGATALAMAARNGHVDVVEVLLKAGARVKFDAEEFATAIQYAAETDRLKIIQVLLKGGATLTRHAVSRAIKQALHTGNLKVVQELVKSRQRIPFTPSTLSHAIPLGRWPVEKQLPLAKVLLAAGADINGENSAAIRNCVGQRNPKLLRFLIEAGAAINGGAKGTSTPLHYAASCDWLEGAKILVEAGARLDVRNSEGKTPAEWAKFHGSKEVGKFLAELPVPTTNRG